ncbi:hypothetical protein DKT77_13705 [Meridianimarinicoccus roseus]|uniref:Uncharacterized protein n=1 Tax=Meridianimarinicoccus roseus TaxID=2072018 RepID=A0A2V2LJN5_9RHOB|nr:hypothetical protein DKT77_13705 [Meridianimarinicoccus roseus]
MKRFHYDSHDRFMGSYNFALRLKTHGGLTPYKFICNVSTPELDGFTRCDRCPKVFLSAIALAALIIYCL